MDDEVQAFISLCFGMLSHYESQQEIAEATNLSQSTISRLWYGKVSPRTHIEID